MRYDGGKGVTYPQLINLIPPHNKYIETHLGGGAVMRHKQPAPTQIGIDLDPKVIKDWTLKYSSLCKLINGNCIQVLSKLEVDENTFIYIDPPYHPETRRRKRVYKHDYTVHNHIELLEFVVSLPCKILISGYFTELYDDYLSGWSTHRFLSKTHVDVREEVVWFNYPKPNVLHDYRYLGRDFREREVIRKRQKRLKSRIDQLSLTEQVSIHKWMETSLNNKGVL